MSKITISHKNGVMELDINESVIYPDGEIGQVAAICNGVVTVFLSNGWVARLIVSPTGAPGLYTTRGEELPFEKARIFMGVDPGVMRCSAAVAYEVSENCGVPFIREMAITTDGKDITVKAEYSGSLIFDSDPEQCPEVDVMSRAIIYHAKKLGGRVKLTLERLED